jgi:transposase
MVSVWQEHLAHAMRGRSRGGSEKLSADQLKLFMEQADEAEEELEAEREAVEQREKDKRSSEDKRGPKGRARRKKLPEDLPHKDIDLDVPDEEKVCPRCAADKTFIGYATSEKLHFQPATFEVHVFRRAKYACKECDKAHRKVDISIAPMPPHPIDGGIPTSGLLAEVITRKYLDHTPIHRLEQIYARHGVELSRNTMYGWCLAMAVMLEPVAKRIRKLALMSHVLQVDDTGVVVLDPKAEGGSKRGHLWSCLGDSQWAAFHFTPDWKAEGPYQFLKKRKGWMQADAYAGFDRLFLPPHQAVEVGCWAHSRRYLIKTNDTGDFRAAKGLRIIGQMFRIEKECREEGLDPDAILQRRQADIVPLLHEFGDWIAEIHPKAPPDTSLGKAVTYFVNQWEALKRFTEDGRLTMTNNDCERQLRHIAVGRANWLFCGSDEGAETTAVLLSCLATAKLAGVNPYDWLVDVLDKLAANWPQRRLDELLPPQWNDSHQASKPVEIP